MAEMIIVHCDWSVDQKKRWMAIATRRNGSWFINQPEPVGESRDFFQRLRLRNKQADTLLVGFDFPIGVPASYGTLTGSYCFKSFLPLLGKGDWKNWFEVCSETAQITINQPFYPRRPGGTKRIHLEERLGLDFNSLLRVCERATPNRQAACSLFWTLGGNQVGKGAISGWRELLQPNLSQLAIWPYDGTLEFLTKNRHTIIVETYPGDVYSQISLPPKKEWSKRKHAGRRTAGVGLTSWVAESQVAASDELMQAIGNGFDDHPAGEDQFDAVVGLFGMIDVLENRRSAAPGELSKETIEWEGWILGQSL